MTNRKEIAGNAAVILFGAAFVAYSTRYPLDTWQNPGPAVFPMILGTVLTILGAWQLMRAFWSGRKHHRRKKHREAGPSLAESALENSGDGKAIRMIALFIIYLLIMQQIGFFVSSFLFAIFISRLAGASGWGKPVLLSAGLTLFCYILFEVWLKLSFPRGIFF
jgi:putative tricarboxylic transport membrane protein